MENEILCSKAVESEILHNKAVESEFLRNKAVENRKIQRTKGVKRDKVPTNEKWRTICSRRWRAGCERGSAGSRSRERGQHGH